MKREGNSLVPADAEAADRLYRMKRDSLVMVTARQPRNPRQHRLAWALARLVWDNTEAYTSPEHVMETVKVNTGYCDTVTYRIKGVGDVQQLKPWSISFESMEQGEFDVFFDRFLSFVVTDMMPGVDLDELKAQLP